MRLLLAEDDRDLRELLCEALRAEGFEVTIAADGLEALERIRAGDRYGALVLDHEMPRMTGCALLSVLRSEGDRTPALIVSGSLQLSKDERSRLEVGPVLRKPLVLSRLIRAIRKAVAGTGARSPAAGRAVGH